MQEPASCTGTTVLGQRLGPHTGTERGTTASSRRTVPGRAASVCQEDGGVKYGTRNRRWATAKLSGAASPQTACWLYQTTLIMTFGWSGRGLGMEKRESRP